MGLKGEARGERDESWECKVTRLEIWIPVTPFPSPLTLVVQN